MSAPKYIINTINSHQTSIGDNPALPPEEEDKFLVRLVNDFYDSLTDKIDDKDIDSLQSELSHLLGDCSKLERNNHNALETLAANVVTEMFNIPEDAVKIESKLVDTIDTRQERLVPEKTSDDFSFDNIEDMHSLTDEIYKRRLLNALIAGAAIFYSGKISYYVQDLFNIEPELPRIYKRIMDLNNIILYNIKDSFDETSTNGGKVDVYLQGENDMVQIKAQALFLPILIEETIKGILELSIAQGLPSDQDKATYIISKSDFKLAEMWDMRLGLPLWHRIEKLCQQSGYDPLELGVNYIFMELALLKPKHFNQIMQEILMGTKEGKRLISSLCEKISYELEQDNFNSFLSANQQSYQINDDEYYSPDDLLRDDTYHSIDTDYEEDNNEGLYDDYEEEANELLSECIRYAKSLL